MPSDEEGSSTHIESQYMACCTENHCCALLHGLQELRKSNTLCDYTLIADGQVLNLI